MSAPGMQCNQYCRMGHAKTDAAIGLYEVEIRFNSLVKKLKETPVSSSEWDQLVKDYTKTAYELCKRSGSTICTIDNINY